MLKVSDVFNSVQSGELALSSQLQRKLGQAGLSIAELAAITGIHRNTISALIHGSKNARPKTIQKLAQALNCQYEDLEYLLNVKEQPDPNLVAA